jgi:Short C-terminal domain
MQPLTQAGEQSVQNLSQRYGVSVDAVKTLLFAVSAGGGSMAQFYHSELGGGGQWMRGGMTMVGDMFNHGLQATVSGLCSELSSLLASQQVFLPLPQGTGGIGGFGNAWWPAELGNPSSSGGQNDARYAYFPQPRRLAILRNGQLTIYDTLDHQIGGVQQQQGGPYGSLSFSSQFGTFTVESLPFANSGSNQQPVYATPAPAPTQNYNAPAPFVNNAPMPSASQADILSSLERLAQLHQSGVLSEDEFRSKKTELLSRL